MEVPDAHQEMLARNCAEVAPFVTMMRHLVRYATPALVPEVAQLWIARAFGFAVCGTSSPAARNDPSSYRLMV
ncbi:hypothetical protein ASD43_00930 [Microbacterium sp. Root553]|nr:hypothetical protein ASD43_00930 [Microbacterium sp. Root553]